jgi:hypothetical protein
LLAHTAESRKPRAWWTGDSQTIAYVVEVDFEPNQPDAPRSKTPRSRTWVIVLVAVLTELVVIAASNNQGVTDWVRRRLAHHQNDFSTQLALASQSYQWRFSGLDARGYAAQYTHIGVTVLLTALLILAVCRGPVRFGRAFFGTWTAVVFASLVGSIASAAVLSGDSRYTAGSGSKATFVLLSVYSSNAYQVLAAFGLGLLTAVAASVAAATTRRSAAGPVAVAEPTPATWDAGYPEPAAPPPWQPAAEEPPRWQPAAEEPPRWQPAADEPPPWVSTPSQRQPAWASEQAETVDMTRLEADQRSTTALPRLDEQGHRAADPNDTQVVRIDDDELPPPS